MQGQTKRIRRFLGAYREYRVPEGRLRLAAQILAPLLAVVLGLLFFYADKLPSLIPKMDDFPSIDLSQIFPFDFL